MPKGIAVAGNLIVDNMKYIDNWPSRHMLTTITDISRSTGGLCTSCTLTLAKLDPALPIKVIGLVGCDEAGDFILSRLNAHPRVDTSRVRRMGATSYTDVMTENGSGARTFFIYRGANAMLSPEHFDFGGLDADILHIGYILLLDTLDGPDPEYPTAMCRVLDAAQKAGIRTSIDVVSEDGERFSKLVPPALRYADYCTINEIEASRTTGIELRGADGAPVMGNLPLVCRKLMDMGVGRWVVVHMPELACGLERGGAYVYEPSWRIPDGFIKSTVGAGDAFASGIIYGAYSGRSLAESIRIAGAVAACSLSGEGASDAIRPMPELLAKMEALQ